MTLRVVLLIRSLGHGGAERQVLLLARGLQARGMRVKIVTLYPATDTVDDTRGLDIRSVQKNHRWDIAAMLRLYRLIAQDAPHVVYSFLTVPNVLAALGAVSLRGFQLVWGIRSSNMDLARYDWLVRATYWLERRLSGLPHLIISNSLAGRDYAAARGLPAAKLQVIHNGFDTERFRPSAQVRSQVRAGWEIGGSAPVIGIVARLDPMKDHPTFLHAAALLVKKRRDLRFVLVGGGPHHERATLCRLAVSLGLEARLIWEYRRSDMPQLYPALDVLCCSSAFGEGLANAVGEAMACGVPCVVTDVGDAPRIVGEAGIVVPPRDPGALALGLEAMLERLETGDLNAPSVRLQATRGRIMHKFSLQRMIEETEHAFRTLAPAFVADAKLS